MKNHEFASKNEARAGSGLGRGRVREHRRVHQGHDPRPGAAHQPGRVHCKNLQISSKTYYTPFYLIEN